VGVGAVLILERAVGAIRRVYEAQEEAAGATKYGLLIISMIYRVNIYI